MIRIANADYLADPLRLSRAEASSLLVALHALRESADPAVLPSIDSAVGKIEEVVGAQTVASIGSPVPGAPGEVRAAVDRALASGRQLQLCYLVPTRDEVTDRVVDPQALLTSGGAEYLDAWCHRADDRRSFRLDRILAADVLDSPVRRHDLAPRDLSDGIFQPSPELPLVTLHLRRPARWIAEYYPVESTHERRGGILEVTLRVADRGWLERLLLRLTPHVRVVGPEEFTQRYRQSTEDVRALYGPRVDSTMQSAHPL